MNYWLFKCNTDMYDLESRLQDLNPTITWNVSRYRKEIKKGDQVFLWVSGKKGGVRAVFEIDTPPIEMAEIESEKPYWKTKDKPVRLRVIGTLSKTNKFIPAEQVKQKASLKNMSIFGYPGATNYPVTKKEGNAILSLLEKTK